LAPTRINIIMDTFIEYISTDTDGNYKFSYTLENAEGEFTLPRRGRGRPSNDDGVNIIKKLIDGELIKPESVTKLQELGII